MKGWHVDIYTRGVRTVDNYLHKLNIEINHAPFHGVYDPASALTIANALRKLPSSEPVVIHCHRYRDAFTALLAKKLVRRKNIRIVTTRHKVARGVNTPLFRRIYRNLDAQIFVSNLAKNRFLSAWENEKIPFPTQRLHVVYTGINIPIPDRPLPVPERGSITALFLGTLRHGQGLETLIDAMALLQNKKIRLRIAGTGAPDYIDRLRNRAISRKVMERIDWKRPAENFYDDMHAAHFGVLPANVEWAAGYDNILFMAAGRAQIATNLGAPAEFLTNRNDALLINANDATILAEAMASMSEDTALRNHIANKALVTFRTRLAWSKSIARITKIYCS